MTANQAIMKWLQATRDQFANGDGQRERLGLLLNIFIDDKKLGDELNEFLQTTLLIDEINQESLPSDDLRRLCREKYDDYLQALFAADTDAIVHALAKLEGYRGIRNDIANLIAAYRTTPRRWLVTYQIISSQINSVVTGNTCEVSGRTEAEAERAARSWIEANDIHYDERIDPCVQFVGTEEIEDAEEEE